MLKSTVAALAASTLVLAALALPASAGSLSVVLKSATGADAGSLTLTEAPTGVLVHVEAKGLTPGWHAMHFHEVGVCSDPKLASAGAHINMTDKAKRPHGLLAVGGPDFGDLPNLYVGADGTGNAEVFTTLVMLRAPAGLSQRKTKQVEDTRPALLDTDGSALIIHANADDYETQPIGGAGDRVACAVIK